MTGARSTCYLLQFDPPQVGFSMVPNRALEDVRLSIEARGALAWMASRPRGWRLSVSDALLALGCGRDRWQRICRELRAVGALARRPMRAADGRILGWLYVVSWAPWVDGDGVRAAPPAPAAKPSAQGSLPLPAAPAHSVSRETRSTVGAQGPENPVDGSTVSRVSGISARTNAEHPAPYQDSMIQDSSQRDFPAHGGMTAEAVDFYTRVLNSGEPVAPSILRPNAARQLVAMGKVSSERLRELGVAH